MRAMYILPLAAFLLIALALGALLMTPAGKKPLSPTGMPLPALTLPAPDGGSPLALGTLREVAVVNVFASWCAPCLLEHPIITQLSKDKGVVVYGIAWRDTPEKVSEWLGKHGNPFHAVGIDAEGASTVALGITGVPETLVVDAQGTVRGRWQEPLNDDMVREQLLPLIERLKATP